MLSRWTPALSYRNHDANLSRRDVVIPVLSAVAASFVLPTVAAPQENDVPAFESGRYQLTILRPRQTPQSIRLFRLEGGTIDLASLRGKPILLNFWASWCAACRTELPLLDQLYRSAWRGDLHVAAVSEDSGDRETVGRFIKSLDLGALPIYLDPNGYVAHSDAGNGKNAPFALYGMPISYLISSSGLVVGYVPGAADWSSAAAVDLIEFLRRT